MTNLEGRYAYDLSADEIESLIGLSLKKVMSLGIDWIECYPIVDDFRSRKFQGIKTVSDNDFDEYTYSEKWEALK